MMPPSNYARDCSGGKRISFFLFYTVHEKSPLDQMRSIVACGSTTVTRATNKRKESSARRCDRYQSCAARLVCDDEPFKMRPLPVLCGTTRLRRRTIQDAKRHDDAAKLSLHVAASSADIFIHLVELLLKS